MKGKQITVVTDFLFQPEKRTILESIECYEHSAAYSAMSVLYDRLVELAATALSAKATYILDEQQAGLATGEAGNYEKLVYCLVTIGDAISKQSTDFFQSGMYAEGLIVDAIANFALFDCSRQLHPRIVCDAQILGLGLTRRLSPGDGDFSVIFQKTILERFGTENTLGITLTDGYMLDPVKSLAYLYGADTKLSTGQVDHDCLACTSVNCKLRQTNNADKTVCLTVSGDQPQQITAKTSQTIMAALSGQSLRLHSPCGGKGKCGKCKVRVLNGRVASNGAVGDGIYLACRTYPLTDCEIDIGLSEESSYQTVSDFQADVLTPDSGFRVKTVNFDSADWKNGDSLTRLIDAKQGCRYSYSLKALRKLAVIQLEANSSIGETGSIGQINLVVREDQVVDLFASDVGRLFGLAIDIGTTTLVLSLVDLVSGKIVKKHSLLNSQRSYGADVISRIQYSTGENRDVLSSSICADIVNCIRKFDLSIRTSIAHIAIAGNTTMLHFLLGLTAESLGRYPFQPITTGFQELSFAELFGDAAVDCLVTVLPGVSAFVGADVVAGLLQCGFAATNKIAMLIDIGTNGEIAIGNQSKILCLATAAGPAFEGANISCGTGSVSGAIATFNMTDGHINYNTIDDTDPIGICGSGVLDIMAACVRERVVDATGKFDRNRFPDAIMPIAKTQQGDWLYFNQKDVRELQLAKSAMRAGMEVLLKAYGCGYDEVETVYLAGSFGTHLNIESAVEIGLLPKQLQAKVKAVGNTSLGGATQYLVTKSTKQEISKLLEVSSHLDLAADSQFNELFIENMYFRP